MARTSGCEEPATAVTFARTRTFCPVSSRASGTSAPSLEHVLDIAVAGVDNHRAPALAAGAAGDHALDLDHLVEIVASADLECCGVTPATSFALSRVAK